MCDHDEDEIQFLTAVKNKKYHDVILLYYKNNNVINSRNYDGNTALHIAAKNKDHKMMYILNFYCKSKYLLNGERETPLHISTRLLDLTGMKILINNMNVLDTYDSISYTPSMILIQKLLIKYNINIYQEYENIIKSFYKTISYDELNILLSLKSKNLKKKFNDVVQWLKSKTDIDEVPPPPVLQRSKCIDIYYNHDRHVKLYDI